MSVVKTYYPKPEEIEIANGKDESTATGANLKINTRNEDVEVRTISSDDPVSIFAGTGNDTLLGGDSDAGNDFISAGDGNDRVFGRGGNDIVDSGIGNDTIDGGIGNDSLNGSAGDDSVIAGDGNDTIIGGDGKDSLDAGAGDDVLNIGTGDSVTSGAGADRINFDLAAGFDASKPPLINDFVSGEDKIAILGQADAKLSYDPTAKELLLDDQPLIQLDANVVLSEGDLVTSEDVVIPFEATAPVTYKLSGTVYNDTNAPNSNAIEAADTPIAGVEVKLYAADGTTAIGSDTTDANGFYEFADLADGSYVVKETQPANYKSVTDKDGGNPDEIKATIAGGDSLRNDFLEETSSTDPIDPIDPVDPIDPPSPYDQSGELHEFYNESENSYFYTIDDVEKEYIENNLTNYEYKGSETLESADRDAVEMAVDPLTGAVTETEVESEEVYRFVNTVTGAHLFTTDEGERDYIEENLKHFGQDESNFYAFEEKVEGSVEVHRFYNAAEDIHMFTHSAADIAEMMAEDSGFNDEGVAFYAMSSDMSAPVDTMI